MMTFSVIWVLLAATVIVLAMLRRTGSAKGQAEVEVSQSGKALILVAVGYSVALIAGFLYIGWQTALH